MAVETGDPEIDAFNRLEEERKREERAKTTHDRGTTVLASTAPAVTNAPAPPLPVDAPLVNRPTPAVAPAGAAPGAPGELPLVKSQSTTTSGWSRVIPHKSEEAILEKQRKTDAEMELLTLEQGTNAILKAKTEQEAANKALEQSVQDKAELDNALGNANWLIAKEEKREQELRDKWMSMENKDYWADKSTGQKILATLAMALGAFGNALNGRGGENRAIAALDGLVSADLAKKQAAQDKMFKAMELQGGNVKRAYDKLGLSVQNYNLRKAADWERVEKEARALMAAQGIDDAEIDGKIKQLGIQEKREAAEMERAMSLRARAEGQTVTQRVEGTAGGGKPPTFEQGRAGSLAGRMIRDHNTLEQLGTMSDEGMSRLRELEAKERLVGEKGVAALIAAKKWKTPEQLLNDRDLAIYGARKRFAAAVLRGDSGAAIGLNEYLDFDRQNFEQIGEKSQHHKLKRDGRWQQIQGVLLAAGPAAQAAVASANQQVPGGVPANVNAAAAPAQASLPPPPEPGARRGTHPQHGPGWATPTKFYPDRAPAQASR